MVNETEELTNPRFLSRKESPMATAASNARHSRPFWLSLPSSGSYRLGSKQLWLDEML
jgi:hypothetical protein